MIKSVSNYIIKPTLRQIVSMMPEEIIREMGYAYRHGARHLHSIWNIRGIGSNGEVQWEELNVHNILHDEGENGILSAFFDEVYTIPVSYYIALDDRASLAEGDILTTMAATEPSGNGYARKPVNTDNTDWNLEQDGGDWQVVSKTATFTASGGPIPVAGVVSNMSLGDQSSGTTGILIASVALSQDRTILEFDSLNTDITIKLSE